MGGAERSARKRKQGQTTAGATAVAAARGSGGRLKVIVGVVVVVLLIAGAVIGGVVYTNNKRNRTEGQTIAAAQTSLQVAIKRDGAVVEVGSADAKATIDVYEDFLCPACREFEAGNAARIEARVADGSLRVRYHVLNMLNEQSDPAGYSTDSANAALLAADEGKFVQFHKSLFDNQPEEGSRGWSKDQLVELGRSLGLTGQAFADGVRSGKYDSLVTAEFDRARSDDSLKQDVGDGRKAFGTPTIVRDGKAVDTSSDRWVDDLVGAGRS